MMPCKIHKLPTQKQNRCFADKNIPKLRRIFFRFQGAAEVAYFMYSASGATQKTVKKTSRIGIFFFANHHTCRKASKIRDIFFPANPISLIVILIIVLLSGCGPFEKKRAFFHKYEALDKTDEYQMDAEQSGRLIYLIGPGDVLNISVWKNPDMSRVVTVLPDGKITFPLIGEIQASGKTVAQLKKELESKLSPRFILDLVLTLEVRQVKSMVIYVIGRVKKPDQFSMNTNTNILQALSMAGGLTPFAERNEIKVFRKQGNKTRIFEFRYDDVTNGVLLEQNIQLKRGDVIVVP